ncbi:hypothetical protein [Streptacidiphilus anmyonensis]|uniref:hypothetical protein n=1 Tax=Streptacidiphilus anmyonensis TaxID=405782 RepID=UPI000693FDA3|nr:hypothetical protein [Streptacidiphilus anmyonensis]
MNRPTRRQTWAVAALAGLLLAGASVTEASAQSPIDPTIPTPTLPAQAVQTTPTGADGCGGDPVGWLSGNGFQIDVPHSTQNGINFQASVHVWDLDGSQQGDSVAPFSPLATVEVGTPATVTYQSGHTYGWYAQTYDGTGYSQPTAACYFKVDSTPPSSPVITNPDFPPVGAPGEPTKESGQPTTFTITGGHDNLPPGCTDASATDCAASGLGSYEYALNDQSSWTKLPVDANGDATLTLAPDWGVQNLYVRSVDAAGFPSQAPSSYTFYVPWQLPGTTTASLTGPATAPRAVPLHLTGQLSGGYHNPGQVLHVTRTDLLHPHGLALPDIALGTDGTYTVTDTPPAGGANTYTVSYPGDAAYAPASASATVQVSRAATALSVGTNASTYPYGATATVTAHLGTTFDGRTVSVYAQPHGAAKVLLRTGAVDQHGNLAVPYRLTRDTVFTAAFAGDSRYAPTTASHTVSTGAALSERVTGSYGTQLRGTTRYLLMHHTATASLSAALTPAAPGSCVRFEFQRWTAGSWKTTYTTACHTISSAGVATLPLDLRGLTGATLRIRAEYVPAAGAANAAAWGGWEYLAVRP